MKKNTSILLSILLLLIIALFATDVLPFSASVQRTPKSNTITTIVQKTVDGDTLKILMDGQEEIVRLIGIDTPECVHPDKSKNTEWGKKASKFTKDHLEGKKIQLELDVQERDRYGRLLAYVFIDEELFNEVLVREGWAKISTYPPNIKYVEYFKSAQKEAQKKKLGIWSSVSEPTTEDNNNVAAENASQKIKGNINKHGHKIYHCPGQKHYEQTVIDESKGERWFDTEEEAQAAGWKKAPQ